MEPIERCRFCKRIGPIIEGRYIRVKFPDGIAIVCADCYEKRDIPDEDTATWQDTEVEVV